VARTKLDGLGVDNDEEVDAETEVEGNGAEVVDL